MNTKHFIAFAIGMLLVIPGFNAIQAQDNVIDEVVWVVGDEPILKSQVENELMRMKYEQQRIDGDPYCIIPEQIAIQKLYLNQAKIDSIIPPEEDVLYRAEAQLNYAVSQAGSKERLEEAQNKPFTSIREEIIEHTREQFIVEQVQKKLIGEIKITPADVRKYYHNLPKDSLPYISTQVEVQLIVFEPVIPLEEIDRVKNRLREIAERVNNGETEFSSQAIMYSEDPGSARQGGELGFISLVPEFANVAYNLQDSKRVSRIVETEYGYHIIQLIERRGDRLNCRHILMKPKVEAKQKNEALARLDSLLVDLRANKFTFEQAAFNLSQDKDTRNNYGLMQNMNMGNSRFQMEELPQEIAKAVADLEPGEYSKPFTMIMEKNNKEVCAIVKLKNRIDGHKANMSDDFQAIKSIVEQKKSQEKLDTWISKVQSNTYIRINEGWQNCDFRYQGWIK